jgi:hypothetical protein
MTGLKLCDGVDHDRLAPGVLAQHEALAVERTVRPR